MRWWGVTRSAWIERHQLGLLNLISSRHVPQAHSLLPEPGHAFRQVRERREPALHARDQPDQHPYVPGLLGGIGSKGVSAVKRRWLYGERERGGAERTNDVFVNATEHLYPPSPVQLL